ncbi:glycosyltransferase family 8 protein [Rhodomicrobium sp. Az07]|uniref:glycosyltransferase family 8 protein n=1 Tax=Rhodomicrobium sp. Az07 TaxID=2839034 RepID=UPI001BEC7B69|nr:glycosyltransferase family 8 protein [Rhodomicrobium sp. Az07]MBT3069799.1 glycosyltransferase family 8 protein [Rhodomicrobium sp. Az07]
MPTSEQPKVPFAVVVCTDKNMLQLACATLYSAHLASPDIAFDKIIVGLDIPPEQEAQVLEFAEKKNIPIKLINLKRDELGEAARKYGGTALRLRIDQYIQNSYERILYLDCDVIVVKSLSNLFKVNLNGYAAAAAADLMKPWKGNYERLNALGLSYGNYFNAGVIMFDMARSRAEGIWERSESELEQFPWRRRDQDVLNKVLAGRWLRLPVIWNFTSPFHYRRSIKPAIVHFAGLGERPWHPGSLWLHREYRNFYRDAFKDTAWSDYIPDLSFRAQLRGEYRYWLSTLRRHGPVSSHLKRNYSGKEVTPA